MQERRSVYLVVPRVVNFFLFEFENLGVADKAAGVLGSLNFGQLEFWAAAILLSHSLQPYIEPPQFQRVILCYAV